VDQNEKPGSFWFAHVFDDDEDDDDDDSGTISDHDGRSSLTFAPPMMNRRSDATVSRPTHRLLVQTASRLKPNILGHANLAR